MEIVPAAHSLPVESHLLQLDQGMIDEETAPQYYLCACFGFS
jgi:hypothetical protein